MSTMRVYQVAKDLGLDPKMLLQKLQVWGISVRNAMSALQPEDVARIKRNVDRESQTNVIEETVRSGVVRRRKIQPAVPKPPRPVEEPVPEAPAVEPPLPTPEPAAPPIAAALVEAPAAASDAASSMAAEPAQRPPEPPPPQVAEETPPAPRPSALTSAPAASPTPTPSLAPVTVTSVASLTAMLQDGPRIISRPPPTGVPGVTRPAATGAARPDVPRRKEFVRGVNLFDAKRKRLQQQQRYKKKRAAPPGRKGQATEITTPSEAKRTIQIEEQIALQTLAARMRIKATEVLMKLFSLGVTDANINKTLDADTAKLLASEFGYQVEDVAVSDEALLAGAREGAGGTEQQIVTRPPIVTVMGHVDHGKTSLLDALRKTRVAESEAGGITQQIGASRLETDRGTVVFLDTPGHEAFSAMRARGAKLTDLVVLVVAADDGVMPQTVEAIDHAKAAGVPIVVAVNKIDKTNAEPEKVKRQLGDHGLIPEDWGGDTIFREVSAKTRQGLDELLEMIALQAEVMELKADAAQAASGGVIEAYLDRGRGAVARVLVKNGTLRPGDIVVAGTAYGKVRAMIDDRGKNVTEAAPSVPVEILGLSGVPNAGDPFDVVADARQGQTVVESRSKRRAPSAAADVGMSLQRLQEMIAAGDLPELRIVLKADLQGSVEAASSALAKLSGEKVRVSVIHAGVGGITESDVNLAAASEAILVGFNVRPAGKAASVAETEGVEVKLYAVIYEMLDDIRKAMTGLLAPTTIENPLGKAEVLQIFSISGVGMIAGCRVTEGKVTRAARVRLVRDSVQVWEGRIASLRRFKEDVKEAVGGHECGIGLEGYGDIKQTDIIEAFEIEEVAPTL